MNTATIEKTLNWPQLTDGGLSVGVTRGRKNPLWFGLAERLRKTREAAGLSGLAASNLAGMGASVWRFVERQEQVPLINTVEKMALALGVPACWLAFGEDGEIPFQQKIQRQGTEASMPPEPEPEQILEPVAYLGLSERMQAARKAAGISMRELSRRAGVSVQSVSLLENGTGIPRIDNCEALALALDVAPCWLAFGVGRGPALN